MAMYETPLDVPVVDLPEPGSAMYRGFFDAARESLLILDAALDVAACNQSAELLFAVPGGVSIGSPFLDSVDDSDTAAVGAMLADIVAGRPHVDDAHAELRRFHGGVFPAEISASRFFVDGAAHIALVVRDRSMEERNLRRLHKEQDLYRTLFANAPVPLREEDFSDVGAWFARLRAQGVSELGEHIDANRDDFISAIMSIRTTRVNPAYVRMMKADSEAELLTGFQSSEFSQGTLDSFRRQFVRFWDGGDYHEAEFIGYDRQGEPFECFLTVSAQRIKGELDLSRVVAAFLDLTEIRANQRSLERLIADKDQFIASVSHELRTPLASVLGLSDELYNHWDRFAEAEIRQLLGIIADQASDLSSLVEDLLVAAKAEMGSLSVVAERVQLDKLVAEAVGEVAISGALDREVPVFGFAGAAHADPVRVRQIVRNLVTNAARYGGDEILVELGRDHRPFVRVIDDGEGIPPEDRERVFDPYHRAGGSDARLGALGLGLTISRQLARVMNGELTYDHVDDRSIFTLILPSAR